MKRTGFILTAVMLLCTLTFLSVSAAGLPFTDVTEGSWYYDSVSYCYVNNYMSGTTDTTFAPKVTLSRAMAATLLASAAGIDKSAYTGETFTDVPEGKWYYAAVEWAYSVGVVSGRGDGTFAPGDPVTREQFALMLYKYAAHFEYDTAPRTSDYDTRFTDSADAHEWAKDALSWSVAVELLTGTSEGAILPRGTATRAEAAVMIHKFALRFFDTKELAGEFTVSRAFGDHMTVQRNEPLSVWGWADEAENGKYIRVSFKGMQAYAKVENGEWKATFPLTFPASSEPAVLYVNGSETRLTFEDVLVGDVYYVMGQSNIYWSMQFLINDLTANNRQNTLDGVTYDDSSNIRLFRNSSVYYMNLSGEDMQGTTKLYTDVRSPEAVWRKPSDGALDFSAIGYLFAFNMSKETDVPIAMIEIDASGYPITAFAPNELAEKWDSDINLENTGVYYMKLGTQEAGNLVVYPLQSRFAYNQQLYPMINFSCAGLLWYQGESDMNNTILNYGKDTWTFSNEIADLMTYFRAHFGNSDFPVYFMEFPSCYNLAQDAGYLPTGTVRSELGCVPMNLEDSYVIPCSDLWSFKFWQNNIHPFCKPAQAKRAASMVLANEYGIGDMNYTAGPLLKNVEYTSENTVVLTFDYVGDGLEAYSEDESGDIYGIQVLTAESYANDNWVNVIEEAQITTSNQITVTYSEPIYGVRYNAVTEYYYPNEVNLSNSAGIPMVAFADYKD